MSCHSLSFCPSFPPTQWLTSRHSFLLRCLGSKIVFFEDNSVILFICFSISCRCCLEGEQSSMLYDISDQRDEVKKDRGSDLLTVIVITSQLLGSSLLIGICIVILWEFEDVISLISGFYETRAFSLYVCSSCKINTLLVHRNAIKQKW